MKVLIVDDHPLFRRGLCHAVSDLAHDVEVHEAGDLATALDVLARNEDAALILLDLMLPGSGPMDGLTLLREKYPLVPIVVVSMHDGTSSADQAMAAGASGFISKMAAAPVLERALRRVLDGDLVVLTGDVPLPPPRSAAAAEAATGSALTPRQLDVLRLLAGGDSNKDIAAELELSTSTVRAHVSAILTVLGVSNRTQAAHTARERRIL